MKNIKAVNVDSIHAEMLKAGLNTSTKVFVDLIRPIQDKDTIPEDWLIFKGQRKGDLQTDATHCVASN